MNRRFGMLFWLAPVLLIIAIGIGYLVFNAGVAQGIAQSVQMGAVEGGSTAPLVVRPFFWHPFGFGFGVFGLLFTVVIIFLVFGVLRSVFWRAGMGTRAFRGSWLSEEPRGGVPAAFEEWHRRAHAQESKSPAETTGSPQP